MEGVTEESREPSPYGQGQIIPAPLDDMLPIGDDAGANVTDMGADDAEPPPDWLEPLEDCEEEEGDMVKPNRRKGRRTRKTNNVVRGRGRPPVFMSKNNWEDCPDLGKGWKRKLIMWRDGKTAAYYMSPTGVRFRSKVQLARHLKVDLNRFDYKQGKFVNDVITRRKRRNTEVTDDLTRSSLSSSRTTTPDLEAPRTFENVATTPKNGPSLPRRLQLTSVSPATPLNNFDINPLLQGRQLSPSPSLNLDISSAQTTSLPPLAPVSPPKTPEIVQIISLNGPNLGSLNLQATTEQNHGLPTMEGCANCGCKFPGMSRGKHLLCPKCRPSTREQPHIVFRKVGQDKWVLGKAKSENSMKSTKIPPVGTKSHPFKSLRLMAQQEKEENKRISKASDEEDDGREAADAVDDGDEYGPRKRKRRMCGRCKACLREQDCGKCDFCLDKTKYGGPNRLRQKCRFRQCQVRSRLQVGWSKYSKPSIFLDVDEDAKLQKRIRPLGKRKLKRRSCNRTIIEDEDDDAQNNEEDAWQPGRRERRNRRRRWGGYRRPKEGVRETARGEMEDTGPGDLNQASYVVCDDSRGYFGSEVLYPNSYVQNGSNLDMLRNSGHQPVVVGSSQFAHGHDLVYTLPGLQENLQIMCNGIPLQLSDISGVVAPLQLEVIPDKTAHFQMNEMLTNNGISLRLSEFLRRNGLEVVEVDTVDPQQYQGPTQEPEPQPEPETAESPPVQIVQIQSLAESSARMDDSSTGGSGLLELLSSLRRTVLPAHWVGVMAKGPVLQLFQCAKLSPMADTVLQIESDFFFQVSVQNQPLLPTHALYERHPARLESVDKVVSLLLDLEELNVCQGYQSVEAHSRQEPLLCARAALCQLLVSQDEDCCEKCRS